MTTITAAPAANRNPGIVPPWLTKPAPATKNPGIVPPWLQSQIRILPVEDEVHILPVDGETQFVSTPASFSPTSLADVLRGR
jgi:hypothetical protein